MILLNHVPTFTVVPKKRGADKIHTIVMEIIGKLLKHQILQKLNAYQLLKISKKHKKIFCASRTLPNPTLLLFSLPSTKVTAFFFFCKNSFYRCRRKICWDFYQKLSFLVATSILYQLLSFLKKHKILQKINIYQLIMFTN